MKDNLIAIAIVLVTIALVVGQIAATMERTPPRIEPVRVCYVTGARTQETIFPEVDWLRNED